MLGVSSGYGSARGTYVKSSGQKPVSQLPSEKQAVTPIAKTASVGRERVNPVEVNLPTIPQGVDAQEEAVRGRISPYEEPALQAQLGEAKSELAEADLEQTGQGKVSSEAEIECECCRNRKYVDGSTDGSVSYQTPTHISPEDSAAKVMAHEQEHVVNEQLYAEQAGREVLSQSVQLDSAICPECGTSYVSGGMTTTVTAPKSEHQFTLSDSEIEDMMAYSAS